MADDSNKIAAEVEAQPSLDELMRRRPFDLSRADRTAMVTILRARRVAWEAKEDAAKAKRDGEAPAAETDDE